MVCLMQHHGIVSNLQGGSFTGPLNLRYDTIFRISPEGTLTTLIDFDGANGEYPRGALLLADDAKKLRL